MLSFSFITYFSRLVLLGEMKSKFTTIDILAMVADINERLVGMRVAQVYDVDHKTYLIKLQKPECKAVLLVESGARLHPTEYEWPKNPAPSGFAMKLRKHVRNKRLESVGQLGVDRVVDLQFGSGDMASHLILEIYDRGNLVLTDHEYNILNILRPRTDTEDVKFAVREIYPVDKCRQFAVRTEQQLRDVLAAAKQGELIRKIINPHLDFGTSLIDHVLLEVGFPAQPRLGVEFHMDVHMCQLMEAVRLGEAVLLGQTEFRGVITYKEEKRTDVPASKSDPSTGASTTAPVVRYQEFHPVLFRQHQSSPHQIYVSFTSAVDEFFSKLESQRLDMKTVQQEREAMKKLDNVRRDHERRLEALQLCQRDDRWRAELIARNAQLVDGASLVVRSALAGQLDWREISRMVLTAQKQGDPVAKTIKSLKLDHNRITMLLSDPYFDDSDDEDDEDGDVKSENGEDIEEQKAELKPETDHIRPMLVDIDLDMSALANAGRFFDMKRSAAKKQQKTIDSSFKALKSAELKTKKTLKEAATIATINKARKVHWFEKFLWFITSENYLVLGGRDQQQNELLVRRYLRSTDVYVHADIHGATSLVIKNPTTEPVPPKTLNEAGTFAVSNSSAWDAKIITSAWWVNAEQVSKTAPTGEYLTTGSFMIRGKKNYLPPCHLVLGFGVLFKLESSSVARHRGERRIRTLETDESVISEAISSVSMTDEDAGENASATVEAQDSDILPADDGEHPDADGDAASQEEADVEPPESADSEEDHDSMPKLDEFGGIEQAQSALKQESDQGDEGQNDFPDTMVEMKHVKGGVFEVVASSEQQQSRAGEVKSADEQRCDKNQSSAKKGKSQSKDVRSKTQVQDSKKPQQPQTARGKRSKMKRAQAKYRDQDEEERQARMAILQSGGKSRAEAAREKQEEELRQLEERQLRQKQRREEKLAAAAAAGGNEDDPEDDENMAPQDSQVLEELTGVPVKEDELLYAIPVCAPYSTLQSYKFKAKLVPGPAKKGKAAKQVINIFSVDRTAMPREIVLIKSLKLEDASRNFPGKVKLGTAQSARPKKR